MNARGFPTDSLHQSRVHRLRPGSSLSIQRNPEGSYNPRTMSDQDIQFGLRRNDRPYPQPYDDNYPRHPHHPIPAPNQPKMKAPSYDGTTPWSDYLVQFELVAELNRWDNHTRALYLATSLRGSAQSVLGDLDNIERHDYEALIDCLNQRFGSGNQSEMFRALLHNRVRQPKESLPDLAHEIRKLVRLAYPTGERAIIETIALEHFIDALSDADTKWRIQQTRPLTLDQAVRIAVELEAFQLANKQKANRRPVRAISTISEKEHQESQIEQIIARMQTLMSEGLQTLENKISEISRPKKEYRYQGDRRAIECYNCGKKGHIRTQCRELTNDRSSRRNQGYHTQGN